MVASTLSSVLAIFLASLSHVCAERYAEPVKHADGPEPAVMLARFRELDTDGDGKLGQAELTAMHGGLSEALQKLIGLADTSGDGSLDVQEVEQLSGYLGGRSLVGAEASAEEQEEDEDEQDREEDDVMAILFRGLDENQDGKIDHGELLQAAAREEVQGFPEVAERLFDLADQDRDGALDRAEAERFMELLDSWASEAGLVAADIVEENIARKSASEEEGMDVDVLADFFRGLDADQDGKIDMDELVAAAAQEEDPGFPALVQELFLLADTDADGALDREEAERFMELLDEHATRAGWFLSEEVPDVDSDDQHEDADDDDDDEDDEDENDGDVAEDEEQQEEPPHDGAEEEDEEQTESVDHYGGDHEAEDEAEDDGADEEEEPHPEEGELYLAADAAALEDVAQVSGGEDGEAEDEQTAAMVMATEEALVDADEH